MQANRVPRLGVRVVETVPFSVDKRCQLMWQFTPPGQRECDGYENNPAVRRCAARTARSDPGRLQTIAPGFVHAARKLLFRGLRPAEALATNAFAGTATPAVAVRAHHRTCGTGRGQRV